MHSVSNANKGKKGQMSLIKFGKLFPLGWCQFRLFSVLFTSILFLSQIKLPPCWHSVEARFIFRRVLSSFHF